MERKIDEEIRNLALEFKAEYEQLDNEISAEMKKYEKELYEYLRKNKLRDDPKTILRIISVLPACFLRFQMYDLFSSIPDTKRQGIDPQKGNAEGVDRQIVEMGEEFRMYYQKKHVCLKMMEKSAREKITPYIKATGVWNDSQAMYELICYLPTCGFRFYLDEHYMDLILDSKK